MLYKSLLMFSMITVLVSRLMMFNVNSGRLEEQEEEYSYGHR
jgi:hypothetical protein